MYGTMEITTKIGCSVNCKFCPQSLLLSNYFKNNNSRERYMSMENYKKCIDKIPSDVTIDFSGMCEPWLNSNCTQMVKYACDKGHKVRIYTTLVGMSEEDVLELSKMNISKFVLHIPDSDSNSNIIIDEKYKLVLTKLMETEFTCLTSLSCHGKINTEIQRIISLKWEKPDNKFIDRAGNLDLNELKHQNIKGTYACSICGYSLNHNVLLPDGTVLLCCMDYGMKHILGNLLETEYTELFESNEAKKIKQNMFEEDGDILCRKCSNALGIEELAQKCVKLNNSIDDIWLGKKWLENEYNRMKDENEKLCKWCDEQQEGKDWLEDECNKLKEENEKLHNWCNEQQEGKDWLESECKRLKNENEKLHKWCDEQQEGKDWLENECNKLKEENEKLHKWCDEQQEGKDWLEAQWKAKCDECDELNNMINSNNDKNN